MDHTESFEAYVAALRSVFPRADQVLRCRAYLRGLLEPSERKNVEAIATAASSVMAVEANLPQALQHFVSNSPWDHRHLLARVRELTHAKRSDPSAAWVIHDAVFIKKGLHSVGVHRQLARSVGRKVNCQIGVILAQFGPRGYFPLAARLYLPGAWLREHAETAARQIPEADRLHRSRRDIAITLLEEVRDSGEPVRGIVADSGYTSSGDFYSELIGQGFAVADTTAETLTLSLQHFDRLKADFGLDHYEGRNWLGWHHHVALVFAAYHFAAVSM